MSNFAFPILDISVARKTALSSVQKQVKKIFDAFFKKNHNFPVHLFNAFRQFLLKNFNFLERNASKNYKI